MLKTADNLFKRLLESKISFCHWKSNIRLQKALSGDDDLDLLVASYDADRFREIVTALGFKRLYPPWWDEYPGVEHFLGYDNDSGQFLHLHIYYKLILGKRLRKDYHVPLEKIVLENITTNGNVSIPTPETEIALHMIRMAAKDTFWLRDESNNDFLELKELRQECKLDKFDEVLKKVKPCGIAEDALRRIMNNFPSYSRCDFIKLRKSMKRMRRCNSLKSTISFVAKKIIGKITKRKKKITGQGKTFALIGIDGSGKSTIAKTVSKKLGWKLEVRNYYLGSSQGGVRTFFAYVVAKIIRGFYRVFSLGIIQYFKIFSEYFLQYSYTLDRLSKYRRGNRDARGGCLVIFDRFPIKGVMDHPSVTAWALLPNRTTKAYEFLNRKLERMYHIFILPPILFFLNISLEQAAARKDDIKDIGPIEQKYNRITNFYENCDREVIRIDATKPIDEITTSIVGKIWESA